MFTLFPCDNNWVLLNSHGLKMCYLIEIIFCANKSSHFLSDTWSLFIFFYLWRMCLPECNSNTTFFVTPSPLCLPSSSFDYIPSGVNMVRFSFTAGKGQSYQEVDDGLEPRAYESQFSFLLSLSHLT